MKKTMNALLARGVDIATAEKLAGDGMTLSTLKQMDETALLSLGISAMAAKEIHSGSRPPIPPENVSRVLFANRYQCCVCRDPTKSIILHHIKHWSDSRDHSEENLAVLCLEHHARAHSKSTLAQNLDSKTITGIKSQWEEACARFDSQAVLAVSRIEHAAWLYFNHQRLFSLAVGLKVNFARLNGYSNAFAAGMINQSGIPLVTGSAQPHMYHGGHGLLLYQYVRAVLHSVLQAITIINISDMLDQGQLTTLLMPGDFIFVQGAHSFKKLNKVGDGPGQLSSGTRQARGVTIKFVLDR